MQCTVMAVSSLRASVTWRRWQHSSGSTRRRAGSSSSGSAWGPFTCSEQGYEECHVEAGQHKPYPLPPAAAPRCLLPPAACLQGALGTHSTADQHEPEEVPGLPPSITSIGAGHFCSFAATAEGELWSWGRNNEGQLGRGLDADEWGCSAVPRPVEALGCQQASARGGLQRLWEGEAGHVRASSRAGKPKGRERGAGQT